MGDIRPGYNEFYQRYRRIAGICINRPYRTDGGVRFIVATHKISRWEIFDTVITSFINDTGGLQAFALTVPTGRMVFLAPRSCL